MRKFDTKVQHLKYKILREVARCAWNDTLFEKISDIPEMIAPGKEATMRCCVYKDRAIISKYVKMAMGGSHENENVVEVIDIACDECPVADMRSQMPAAAVLLTDVRTFAKKGR